MEETLAGSYEVSAELELFSGSSTPSRVPASSDTGSGDSDPAGKARVKPIPRKGHRKSRRGCLPCKRRKVKCPETLPECNNCIRLGLTCQYPRPVPQHMLAPQEALQSTPTLFTMEDLRFFQHFLLAAYPPLPFHGEAIWRSVAAFSHGFDYLIHAMLGLAASHLDMCSQGNYSAAALRHRVTAIRLLNESLGKPCTSNTEGDARFAAMMALTFQASYMADGMLEFLSMTRGCYIISTTAMPSFDQSLFRGFSREGHTQTVKTAMGICKESSGIDSERVINPFLRSLRAFMPLCRSTLQLNFIALLEGIAKIARTSAVEAFAEMATSYGLLHETTNQEYEEFMDPNNHISCIILMHFFLIEFLVGSHALGSADGPFLAKKKVNLVWLRRLASGIPREYEKNIAWLREFEKDISDTP